MEALLVALLLTVSTKPSILAVAIARYIHTCARAYTRVCIRMSAYTSIGTTHPSPWLRLMSLLLLHKTTPPTHTHIHTQVWALTKDGLTKWQYETSKPIMSTPLILPETTLSDGTVHHPICYIHHFTTCNDWKVSLESFDNCMHTIAQNYPFHWHGTSLNLLHTSLYYMQCHSRARARAHTHTRKTRYTRTPIYIHSCHAYTQIYTNICTCRFMQVSQGVVLNCPLDRVPYTLHTHTHTHTRTRT